MRMSAKTAAAAVAFVAISAAATVQAQAACLNKGAEATSYDAESAKWFALETMVQSVSWGVWPAFVANGSTPGWTITRQSYQCKPSGASIYCKGTATFCPAE